ncbi:uncharacterized protein LOC135200410 isoform X2 [Macrobrachium nipponense]|uniref:uncharacterized protein LOC135200410 isoform X2 n=1 Tax=Macrobrachium nipponense TaxID=159736 RepID=UPI0030C7F4D5
MYILIISLSLITSTSSQRGLTWWRELKSGHDGWPKTSLALDQHLDPASQKPLVKRKLLPHSILSEAGIVTELLSRDYGRALHLRTDIPEDTETVVDIDAAEEEEEVLVLPQSSSQLESNAANQMLEPAKVLGVTRGTAILLPLAGRNVTNSITFSTSDLLIHIFRVIASDYNIILLHDDHPETQNAVSRLLKEESRSRLIIVNISDRKLADEVWMGHYNDGMDVHILFYSEVATVTTFADGMPHPVWAPDHLLLINAGGGDENATALLRHKAFSHSPYLTLLQEDRRIQSRTIYEILVYEAFRKGNKVIKRGSIRSPNDSTLTFDVLFPDRFESFHGHYFHLSSWVDDFPYMVKGKTLEDTHGMCIYMLDDIAGRLNFTYKVYELPEDHLWGDLHNGSWRGMIGEVWRGERDFCINVMSLVEDRFQAVDFSVPYFLDSDSFVIRNPDAPPRWPSIIFPFSWVTWIAVGITLLLVPIFFLCLQTLKGAVTFDSSSLFMEVTKALLWLDFSPTTSHLSIRIFVGNWWLMAMILSISYTGNLIAFITIPAKAHKMKTLQEVAESDLTWRRARQGSWKAPSTSATWSSSSRPGTPTSWSRRSSRATSAGSTRRRPPGSTSSTSTCSASSKPVSQPTGVMYVMIVVYSVPESVSVSH